MRSKPYICHICERTCATPLNLRNHLKILHKVELTIEEIQANNLIDRVQVIQAGQEATVVSPLASTTTWTEVHQPHTIIVQTYGAVTVEEC